MTDFLCVYLAFIEVEVEVYVYRGKAYPISGLYYDRCCKVSNIH